MDDAACRRAAIESLSENLTDGFTSPLAWYAVAGLPGLVVFKVVSTMDSMVGYKTPRYLRVRLVRRAAGRRDELRAGAPDVAADRRRGGRAAGVLRPQGVSRRPRSSTPSCSVRTRDGAKRRPPAGFSGGSSGRSGSSGPLVTDVWIGDPNDPPAETHDDVIRGVTLVTASGLAATLLVASVIGFVADARLTL